ncbi:MAG: hypothetical protein JNJ77_19065 [Planctomycetia bacterium]|nr:hypothetical protein [Planctomycetia bacterium]
MSDNASAVKAPPLRTLTPEASNVLGFWWLAIVTAVVLMVTMWPSIFTDSSSTFPNYVLVIFSLVLIGLGLWCTIGFLRAQPWSARMMRLITLIGLGVGLAGVGYFLYSVAFAGSPNNAPSFWGPSGVLSGVMWTLIILLPFIFGLTLIFGLMNEAIDEWFNAPPEALATEAHLAVDPKTAALIAGGAGALSADLDTGTLQGQLSKAMPRIEESESIEVIGDTDSEDLSVEVIGAREALATGDTDSMAELAALEEALKKDASKKGKSKTEKKLDTGKGDEPLAVDDDFKL